MIILFTDDIKFAKILSKFRPPCCIACPTKQLFFKKVMRLIRGVVPFLYDGLKINSEEELIKIVIEHFGQENIIQNNANIIVINAYVKNDDKKINCFNTRNGMYICNI